MARPVTLFSLQFSDLSLEEFCRLAKELGYDGIELSAKHIDLFRAARDPYYARSVLDLLERYGLICRAMSNHLTGQCVTDTLPGAYDRRVDSLAPQEFAGDPKKIRAWAIDEMKLTAHAAKALNIGTVTFFTGSPIWKFWYAFPDMPQTLIEEGWKAVKEAWVPILDEFDLCGVRLALEVHPTEIAYDYWSTKKLLDVFDWRPTLGINFDPSHLLWQGVDPAVFALDFASRIYHVHMKDTKLHLDGRNGILGSHLPFGDPRRGWNFVSVGHGDVDFDAVIRALNTGCYDGPLSVEWEDAGMDRIAGAAEACQYTRKINFSPVQ